jgi:hypothetical protein
LAVTFLGLPLRARVTDIDQFVRNNHTQQVFFKEVHDCALENAQGLIVCENHEGKGKPRKRRGLTVHALVLGWRHHGHLLLLRDQQMKHSERYGNQKALAAGCGSWPRQLWGMCPVQACNRRLRLENMLVMLRKHRNVLSWSWRVRDTHIESERMYSTQAHENRKTKQKRLSLDQPEASDCLCGRPFHLLGRLPAQMGRIYWLTLCA